MDLTFITLLLFVSYTFAEGPSRGELSDMILHNYSSDNLPIGGTTVYQAMYLTSIEVNEAARELSITAMVRHRWVDTRLSWKAEIQSLTIPARHVWKPDIVMENAVEPETVIIASKSVDIDMGGNLRLIKRVRMTSFCNFTEVMDMTYQCEMVFICWDYFSSDVDLQASQEDYILMDYTPSGNWTIVNTTVKQEAVHYASGTSVKLIYILFLEKTQPDVVVTSSSLSPLPVVFIGFMAPLQFLIPLESKERLTFGGLLILAGTVTAIEVYKGSPAVRHPLSFESYCNYILTLLFLAVILSVINLHMCTSNGKRLAMLNFFKKGVFAGLHRIVFVAVPKFRDVRVKRPHVVIEHRMDDLTEDKLTDDIQERPKPSKTESEQMTEIIDILVPMAEDRGRCEIEAKIKQDWLTIGLIIDRLLFIIFFLVFIFCSFGYVGK